MASVVVRVVAVHTARIGAIQDVQLNLVGRQELAAPRDSVRLIGGGRLVTINTCCVHQAMKGGRVP